MTDKNDYTAKIRAKGLEGTGVTEDIAKKMFHSQGKSTLAVVELVHKRKVDDDDTGRQVELVLRLVEPSTDETLNDHLRQLMRTMQQNRVLKSDDQQLQIDVADDLEPTVEQVVAAGKHHEATTDDPLPDDEDPVEAPATGDETAPATGDETTAAEDASTCPYPGCALDEHGGPHRDADGIDISPTAAAFSSR